MLSRLLWSGWRQATVHRTVAFDGSTLASYKQKMLSTMIPFRHTPYFSLKSVGIIKKWTYLLQTQKVINCAPYYIC